jgi:colanic acid biosynthesis glycosyl transferase WcaI
VVLDGYPKRPRTRETLDGMEVIRTWHLTSPSRAIPARAAVFASQALAEAAGGLSVHDADVVLVYGPPLVGPLVGALVAARHGAALVNVVYDVYPDIAVETGAVRNRAVIAAARLAERLQYRAADRTVVLSEGFRRLLRDKGVPDERIAVVPVWLDPDEIGPGERDNAWRREHGIALEQTVVLYAGTIGVVSGAAVVAEAARLLAGDDRLLFLIVGEGAAKDELAERARSFGLTNLRLLPFQPRERLAEVQATADLGLVTLAPGRGRTSVPSKVLGYMAAGRPTVAAVDADSDTARQVEESRAGVVCAPGDPAALAAAVRELADDPARRARMGGAARAAFERDYARPRVLGRYAELLQQVADGRR